MCICMCIGIYIYVYVYIYIYSVSVKKIYIHYRLYIYIHTYIDESKHVECKTVIRHYVVFSCVFFFLNHEVQSTKVLGH